MAWWGGRGVEWGSRVGQTEAPLSRAFEQLLATHAPTLVRLNSLHHVSLNTELSFVMYAAGPIRSTYVRRAKHARRNAGWVVGH